jgi:sugar-specific transcriptional regulator TrmB
MNIVLYEIKKIFNPKMVIFLLIINVIMYFLFIEFDIKYFPNGRPANDIYRIMVEMKSKYGDSMDEKEFKDFKAELKEKIREADRYINEHKEFKEAGVKNYKGFIKETNDIIDKNSKDKIKKLHDDIIFSKGINVFWEIPERDNIIEMYKDKKRGVTNSIENPNKNQEKRLEEIIKQKSEISVFHGMILENYQSLIFNVAMTILLSIIFMISPIFISDSKNKVKFLQYTSKRGRKIFKSKLTAGSISSLIIATVQLTVFFFMYRHNKVGMFFDSTINSFLSYQYFWYDITFIEYIIISVATIYILVLFFSIISMIISSVTENYIALVGVQIPIVFITFKLALRAAVTGVVSIRFREGDPIAAYLLMIIAVLMLITMRWEKGKIVDVM